MDRNNYCHPTREDLLVIFNITWQRANLYRRKTLLTHIGDYDEKEGRFFSLLNKNYSNNDRLFIKNCLAKLDKKRERLKKQHYYLKKIYQERNNAEEKGVEYKQVEYDKERIREIPITRVLTLFGHNVKYKSHDNVFYNCMFHNEKTPSFCVTPSKNLYHCHGCHAGGDVISLYQHLQGCSFPQALKELNNLI